VKKKLSSSRAMALIVVLSILVIIAILAVGLTTAMRLERASARNNFESLQARVFAEMALNQAMGLIQDATTAGTATGKLWASQPGKITVFNSDGSVDTANSKLLYSSNTVGATTNVDLNQVSFGGVNPIASSNAVGTDSAPQIKADWVNVLENPSAAAGPNNKVVGRYAFWVDDETTKININAADGGSRASTNWYGAGNPADVNLQALFLGGSGISPVLAQAIAERTGIRYTKGATNRFFNSDGELAQISGAGTNLLLQNNFNITAYSKAPELNIFGEPKIYLMVATNKTTGVRNAMVGDYGYKGDSAGPGATTLPGAATNSQPLTQIYPLSSQLPLLSVPGLSTNLPQYFQFDDPMNNPTNLMSPGLAGEYALGYRIAQYLMGTNSQGRPITWPNVGTGTDGFAGKYTKRQIDSIVLQLLSLMKRGVLADQSRSSSLPYVIMGWLSGQPVKGVGRTPKLNEVEITFTTASVSPKTNVVTGQVFTGIASVSMNVYLEWYLPKEYTGYPLTDPYDRTSSRGFTINSGADSPYLNAQDLPKSNNPALLGGHWRDNLLYFVDQDGAPAGVDLAGNSSGLRDPDQTKAAKFHPWLMKTNGPSAGFYAGAGPATGTNTNNYNRPALRMNSRLADTNKNPVWGVGEYHSVGSYYPWIGDAYITKTNETRLYVKGGLAIWAGTASGEPANGFNIDPVPIDSIRGLGFTGQALSSVRDKVLEAVLPMPADAYVDVPGTLTVHFEVADPLVNSMPGDWIVRVSHSSGRTGSMQYPTDTDDLPTHYTTGMNDSAKAALGGDPASLWWPAQTNNVTKLQRFPSVGYLQYLRTGMMPDKDDDAKPHLTDQKGTPFRMLNFSPASSSSQKTIGGVAYPDWAMLDLFTVPASLQPLADGTSVPSLINLTAGGATVGRLNPNIPVLPSGTFSRIVPLESFLKGQQASTNVTDNPTTNTVDEVELAQAINSYLSSLGRPLMFPGEICNVPKVAAYLYQNQGSTNQDSTLARSRNDLVRGIVGNLTTRSNTFTVWVAGQAIKKKLANSHYDQVESGDAILGESRMEFVIERYIDLGADGVPGNAGPGGAGADGVVGTPDDVVDAIYNPSMTYPLPYKYRVISARQITQ